MEHGHHSGMWVPGEPPTWGRMLLPHLDPWSVLPVLSAHVVVTSEALAAGHGGRVLDALCECLGEHFDMAHCTFQLESGTHAGHESPVHD